MARFKKGTNVSKMSIAQVKKDVASLKKKVKKSTPEVKNHYRVDQVTVPTNSGAIYNLAAIPQSVGPNGRIGNQVHAIRFKSKIDFLIANSPAANQTCRVILFRDLANTQTTVSQILDLAGTVNAPQSTFNDEERKRFRVLYDKRFRLCNFAGASPGRLISINKKLNFPIGFEDTTSTVFKNNLKLLIISDVGTTASSFSAVHELMYTDV